MLPPSQKGVERAALLLPGDAVRKLLEEVPSRRCPDRPGSAHLGDIGD
jgi:hypothetical protein